jgi:hypothetical protein
MDKMLIAVFERESQASAAAGAMKKLSEENLLLIYASAVIAKDLAKVSVVDFKTKDCRDPALGMATRSVIKLLAEPYDSPDNANSSPLSDRVIEVATAGVDSSFTREVARHLLPGRVAIVSEIEEEATDVMDNLLESRGGTVFRCLREELGDVKIADELDALHSEIQTLETEILQGSEDSKAQLRPMLDRARASFEAMKDRARQHAASIKREAEAKIVSLQERTAKADDPSKARLQKLADEIRIDYVNRATKLNLAWRLAGNLFTACFLFVVLN